MLPRDVIVDILSWLSNPEPEAAEIVKNDRRKTVASLRLASPKLCDLMSWVPIVLRYQFGSSSQLRSLTQSFSFSSVHLAGRGLGNKGLENLLEAFRQSSVISLEGLYLEANKITPIGVKHISRFLNGPAGVKMSRLCLNGNPIGDEGVAIIADALHWPKSPPLSYLGLYSTRVTDDSARTLSRLIASRNTIKTLDLDDNHISCEGVASLASVMQRNAGCGLKELLLGRNGIGDIGGGLLAEALLFSPELTELNLKGNFNITRRTKEALVAAKHAGLTIRM